MPRLLRHDFSACTRRRFGAILIGIGGLSAGCKCGAESRPAPSSSASARVPEPAKAALPAAARCREVAPGKSFEVSGSAAKRQNAEPLVDQEATVDSEDDIPLPFAAELGAVHASQAGFAVGVLRARGAASHAAVAVVEPSAASGKLVELERVHGDPEPPTVVFNGADLIAAVPDNDASGGMLRVAIVHDVKGAARVTWGDDIVDVRSQAGVGGIAISGEQGFIVFVSEHKGKSSLAIARFDSKSGKRTSEPEPLLEGEFEAETARLVPRPGGYWLTYLRTESRAKGKIPSKDASPNDDELMLEGGEHSVQVLALDNAGKPGSSAVSVTPVRKHEILFDVASLPSGDALIAYRGDDTAPGAESGSISLSVVHADGTKEQIPIPGEKLEAGAPSLLADAQPKTKNSPSIWLSATGERNATWFSAIAPNGRAVTELQGDAIVRGAALLAVHGGNILIGRSKGTSVELSAIDCRPDAAAEPTKPAEAQIPEELPAEE